MEQQVQLHRGISRNVLRHGWIPRLRNMAGRFSATLQRISMCCTVRESDTRGITKDIIQAHVNICKKVSEESFCLAPKSVVSEISASSLQSSVKKPENDQLCEGRSSAVVSSTSGCQNENASDAVNEQSTLASMSLSATSVASCTDNTDALSETSSKEELSTLKDEVNNQGNGMGGKGFNDDGISEAVAVKIGTTATQYEINKIDTSQMAKSSAIKEDLGVQAVEESMSSGIQCSLSTTEVCSQSDDSGKAATQVCEENTGSQNSNPDTEEQGLQVCQQMTSSETQYEADTSNVSTEAEVAVTSTAIQNTAELLDTSIQAVKDTTTTSMQAEPETQDMGTQLEDESVSSGIQCSPSTTEICFQSDDSEKKITEMSTQVEVVVEPTGSQHSNPDTAELELQVCQQMTSSETQYEADSSNVSTQAGAAVTSTAIQNTAEMLDTSIQAVKDTTTRSMQAEPETQDMGTQWEDDRTDVNTQTDKDETDKPNTGIQAVIDSASMSIQAEPDIQDTGTQWEDERLSVTTQTEKDEKEITTQTDDSKTEDMPSHILDMVNKYVVTLGHNISRAAVEKKFQSFLEDLKESGGLAIEAKAESEPALADDDTITRNTATEEPNTVSSKVDTLEIIKVPNSSKEEKDDRGISSITAVEMSDDSTQSTVEVRTPDTTDVKLDEFLKPGAKSTFVKLPEKSTFVKPPAMQFKKRPSDEHCLPSKQHGETYSHTPADMAGDIEPSSQSDTEYQHIFRTLHLSQSETALGINTDIHERRCICGKSDVRVVKSQTSPKNIKVDDLLKELQSIHQMMLNSSANLQCSEYSNPELRTANTADEITASSSQNEGHEQSCLQTSMDNIHHGTTDALYSLGFRNIGPASNAQSFDFVVDFWQTPDQKNDAADTSGENVCPQGQSNADCFLNEQNTGKGSSAQLTEVYTLDIEDISVELAESVKEFAPVNRTSSEVDISNISGEMAEESGDFENQSSTETPLIMGISDELAEAMQGCERENHQSSSTSVVARKKSSDDLGFPLPGTGWLKQTTSIPYFALLDHDPPNKNEHALELRGTRSESNLDSTKWNFNLKSVSNLGSALLTRQPTPSREESGQQHEPPDTKDLAINVIGCVQEIQNLTQDDLHVIEEGNERLEKTANIVMADKAEKMECYRLNDSEYKVSLTTTIPHDKEPATNDAVEVEKAKSSNQVIKITTREDKDDMVTIDHSKGSSADGKTPDSANFKLGGVKKGAVNDDTSIDVPMPSFKKEEERLSAENILPFGQNAECHSHIPADIPGDILISQSDPCMSQSEVLLRSDIDKSGEDIYSTSDARLVRSVSNQKINVDNLLEEFHSNTSISLQCSDGSDSEIRKANIADEMTSSLSQNDKPEESWPQTSTVNDYHRTDALYSLGFRNIGPASNSQCLDLVMNSWKIPDQGNDAANISTDVASLVMADKAEMMECNRLCESEYQMTLTTTIPDDKEPATNDAAEVEKAQPSKNKVINITEVSRENKDDESISIKTTVDKTDDSTENSINVNTECQSHIPTDMPVDNNLINQSDPDMRHILRVPCMSQSEVKLGTDTDTSGEDICGTSDPRLVRSVSNQKKINVENLLKEFQRMHQMNCNTSENLHCSDNSDSEIRNGNIADEMTASSSQHEGHEQNCPQTVMDNANCGTTDALYSLGFRHIGQASNPPSLDFMIDSWQGPHQGNGADTSRDGPNLQSEPYVSSSLNERNSGKVASVQLTEIYIVDRDSDLTEASTDSSKQTQSSSEASFVVISEEPSSRSASISVISENPLPRPKSNQYIPFMDHDPPNSKEFAMQLRGTKSESNLDSTKWNLKSILKLGTGLLLQQPTPTPNTEESDQEHEPPVTNGIAIIDVITRLQRIQESNQADGMQIIQEFLRPLENLVRTDTCNTGIENDPAVESTESISKVASSSQNVQLYLDLPQTSACLGHEMVQGDSSTNLENVTQLSNNSPAFTNNNEFDNGFDHWYSYDQGLNTVYKHGNPRTLVEDNARNSKNGEEGDSCSTSHEHKTDVDKEANLQIAKNGITSMRSHLSQATEGGEIQGQHPSQTSITGISGDSEFGETMEDYEFENQYPSETSIIGISGKFAKTMEECEIQTEKGSETSNMGISRELAEAMEGCEMQSQASSEAANMSKSGKHADEIEDSENTNHPCTSVVGKKSSSDFQGFPLPGTGWLKRTTSIPYFALLDHDPPDTKELALELRGAKSESNQDSTVWKFDLKSSITIGSGLPTQQTASSLRRENHGQENEPPERNDSDIHSMCHQPDLQNSMQSDDKRSTVGCQKGSPPLDEQATKKLSEIPKQEAPPIRTTETNIVVMPCENHTVTDNPSSDRGHDFTKAATISVTQPKHPVNRIGRYELFEQKLPGSNVEAVQIHEHESKRDRQTDPRSKTPDFGPANSAVVELQDFPKDNTQSKLQHHNNSPDTDDCSGILHPGNPAYQSAGVQIFEQKHPGSGITTVQIVENRMPGNFAGNEAMHMQYLQELQNCQQIAPDNRLSDGRDIQQESHGSSLVKNRAFQEEWPQNDLHFAESTQEDVHNTQRSVNEESVSANEESVRNDQEEHKNKSNASTHNPTSPLGSCECPCSKDLQELPRNELHFAESIQEEDHITPSANEEPVRNEEHQTKSNGSTHNLTRHLRSCECPCCKDMQELLASGLKMHQDFLPEDPISRQLQELPPESSKERVTEFLEELSLNEPLPIEYMPDVIIPAEKSSTDSFVFAGSSITSCVVHSSDSDAAPQIMYTDEYLEATNIEALEVESLPADTESNESWMNVCRHSSSHIGVPATGESSSDTSDSWVCVETPECSGQEVSGRKTAISASEPPNLQGYRRNAPQHSEEDKVRLDEKINSKVSSRHTQF